jgi:hypothetical protein
MGSTLASLVFLGLSVAAMAQLLRATGIVRKLRVLDTGGGDVSAMLGGFICIVLAAGIVLGMLSLAERRLQSWQPDGGRAPAPAMNWNAAPPRR